jgi:hypothetical protein
LEEKQRVLGKGLPPGLKREECTKNAWQVSGLPWGFCVKGEELANLIAVPERRA